MSNPTTGNVYRQLRELVAPSFTGVGEITAVNGDGTVKVALVGGGDIIVTGSGSVSSYVFVNDGQVKGTAPSLTATVLDV